MEHIALTNGDEHMNTAYDPFMSFWRELNEIMFSRHEASVQFYDARHLFSIFVNPYDAADHEIELRQEARS
jgi:hypothetical protein